jgi:hypothetical protein
VTRSLPELRRSPALTSNVTRRADVSAMRAVRAHDVQLDCCHCGMHTTGEWDPRRDHAPEDGVGARPAGRRVRARLFLASKSKRTPATWQARASSAREDRRTSHTRLSRLGPYRRTLRAVPGMASYGIGIGGVRMIFGLPLLVATSSSIRRE